MNSGIELLRLFAVILITFTHTRHTLNPEDPLYTFVELVPPIGTAVLSVVSGYLYWKISRKTPNLFARKIKSLAIPYLIANGAVLIIAVLLKLFWDINMLHRLQFDANLILNGVFALNAAPVNPPTFFIRDIFMIFMMIEVITKKNVIALVIVLIYIFFGTLFLRWDITFLFMIGVLYAVYEDLWNDKLLIIGAFVLSILSWFYLPDFIKFPVSLMAFLTVLKLKFTMPNVGRYTYLLHLYHSPIIVGAFHFLPPYFISPSLSLFLQISTALVATYLIFLLIHRFQWLKFITGGR